MILWRYSIVTYLNHEYHFCQTLIECIWHSIKFCAPLIVIVIKQNFIVPFFFCTENDDETGEPQEDHALTIVLTNSTYTGARDACSGSTGGTGNGGGSGKRRFSLAQKMTSNLRRLSGAPELKIDITEASPVNNSKFLNKKIKVSSFFVRLNYF